MIPQGCIERAQLGLQLMKTAILELAKANPDGITNSDAASLLDLLYVVTTVVNKKTIFHIVFLACCFERVRLLVRQEHINIKQKSNSH